MADLQKHIYRRSAKDTQLAKSFDTCDEHWKIGVLL